MKLHDAHCHLQAAELRPHLQQIVDCYRGLPLGQVVVNGTCESDWGAVAELAERFEFVRPAFGIHPWKVGNVSSEWVNELKRYLDQFPRAGLGEVGLDRWIQDYDFPLQETIFREQLELAAERSLPVSVHCLQAWGKTLNTLREYQTDNFRFLLHSYGGSEEMIDAFLKIGGYFSISGYFSLDRKRKQREILKHIPPERLLIETDAPEMGGEDRFKGYSILGDESINHPANIQGVYEFVSELLEMPLETLAALVDSNFQRFWQDS